MLNAFGRTYPPFCVDVHENAWMAARYGVSGVEMYLERFRAYFDWAAVWDRCVWYAFRR